MSSTYYDTSYPPSLWTPPAPIPATGVIPGTPGTFQPLGCDTPADLAELQGLGALGETTAWTTGQYVVLGDSSNAYWNGTAWVAGISASGVQAPSQAPVVPQEATDSPGDPETAPSVPEAPQAP